VGLRNKAYLTQHHDSCLRISGTADFVLRPYKEKQDPFGKLSYVYEIRIFFIKL